MHAGFRHPCERHVRPYSHRSTPKVTDSPLANDNRAFENCQVKNESRTVDENSSPPLIEILNCRSSVKQPRLPFRANANPCRCRDYSVDARGSFQPPAEQTKQERFSHCLETLSFFPRLLSFSGSTLSSHPQPRRL